MAWYVRDYAGDAVVGGSPITSLGSQVAVRTSVDGEQAIGPLVMAVLVGPKRVGARCHQIGEVVKVLG